MTKINHETIDAESDFPTLRDKVLAIGAVGYGVIKVALQEYYNDVKASMQEGLNETYGTRINWNIRTTNQIMTDVEKQLSTFVVSHSIGSEGFQQKHVESLVAQSTKL